MRLIDFLDRESGSSTRRIIVVAVVSGFANAILLAVVNDAAERVVSQEALTDYFFLYLTALLLFVYTQKYSVLQAILAIEEAICRVRIRIADKIRHTEFTFIERSGRGDIYTRLTQDSNLVSQAVPQLTAVAQAALLAVFSFFYLAWVSPISFFITMAILGLSAALYLPYLRGVNAKLHRARQEEAEFYDSLAHLLDGFKEIKINRAKSDDLFAHIQHTSRDTQRIKVEVGRREMRIWGYVRVVFYSLLIPLVFILPQFRHEHVADIYKVTATVLFIMGPANMFANAIPVMTRTNVALENLRAIEGEIDRATRGTSGEEVPAWTDFGEVRLEGLHFAYGDAGGGFSVGPLSLALPKGEVLFVVGGNGSGKSTFLKLLVGLYYPDEGAIYRDGDRVDACEYPAYRELFSIIFTDFHLFDRLYGLSGVATDVVQGLLEEMELATKTRYSDGRFADLDLSTGQKKRLAFIAALLEDKPILVFDELAADQDPQFRQYFYETILRQLKARGKTVVAVTHDDKYFHVADRVLKMDNGVFVPA